ncbi:MAG: response regulator [Myxococcales bacterium]|nr:response regulator [Myxococcales bacterium]
MSESEIDPSLRAVLREEVAEALDRVLDLIPTLSRGSGDELAAALQQCFRILHNVKGATRMAGLDDAELAAHMLEERFAHGREHAEALEPGDIERLRRCLMLILRRVEGEEVSAQLDALVAELGSSPGSSTPSGPADPEAPSSTPAGATAPPPPQPSATPSALKPLVRVEAERLDRLMDFAGELLSQHVRQQLQLSELSELRQELDAVRASLGPEARQRLAPIGHRVDQLVARGQGEVGRLGQLSDDFGWAIKRLRMQPLMEVTLSLRRSVLEVAEQLGKELDFVAEVGDLELDRQILDALRDPLMHLLRNAIDHGMEAPAERLALDKPRRGRLQVRARAQGAMVAIEVADDGRGIDLARVREQARARRLLPEGDRELSDAELLEFIFTPGFSTAEQVSRVSGRGVGLDVVSSRVRELGGSIAVDAQPGRGSRFELLVPVSVVSTKGLLVKGAAATYALPLSHVARTLRVEREAVRSSEGSAAIEQKGQAPLKLRWLGAIMGEPRRQDPAQLSVVVLEHGQRRLGLVVGEVLGESEFVSKRLPWNLRRVAAVAGGVVRADGSVALVVDIPSLLGGDGRQRGADDSQLKIPEARRKRRILVVDDSLTSRTLERNILEAAGFEVVLAADGVQGLQALSKQDFDLVVSDVQMPEMDGLELTRRIRASPRHRELAVILVTSLDRPEDIREGGEAGADEYIVKGQFDQRVLLEAIDRLL